MEEYGLLVVMEWTLHTAETDNEEEGLTSTDRGESDNRVSSESEGSSDEVPENRDMDQSSVDFKCIGVTRDPTYQSILLDVRDMMESGHIVPIKTCTSVY